MRHSGTSLAVVGRHLARLCCCVTLSFAGAALHAISVQAQAVSAVRSLAPNPRLIKGSDLFLNDNDGASDVPPSVPGSTSATCRIPSSCMAFGVRVAVAERQPSASGQMMPDRARHVLLGAIAGAGVGAVVGFLLPTSCRGSAGESCSIDRSVTILVPTAAGLLVGALIGAALPSH